MLRRIWLTYGADRHFPGWFDQASGAVSRHVRDLLREAAGRNFHIGPVEHIHFDEPLPWPANSSAISVLRTVIKAIPVEPGEVAMVWSPDVSTDGAGMPLHPTGWFLADSMAGLAVLGSGNLEASRTDPDNRHHAWLAWHELLHALGLPHARDCGGGTDTCATPYRMGFGTAGPLLLPSECEHIQSHPYLTAYEEAPVTHKPPGTICNCNLPGWMPGVEHLPIQWQRPEWVRSREGTMRPVVVVDHIMQGYLSTMVAWRGSGESKIIAHFGISRDRRIVQFQDIFTPGIHVSAVHNPSAARVAAREEEAFGANLYSIGIEHEGCSVDPRPAYTVPPAMIYSITNPWPEPMVEASIAVKRWCFANAPSLGIPSTDSIIGHYEADMRNRPDDPAHRDDRRVWPRARMIAALAQSKAYTPEQQQMLDWLRSEQGQSLTAESRRKYLLDVGLTEADLITPQPPPAPEVPPSPPAPEAPKPDMEVIKADALLIRAAAERILAETAKETK